MNVFQNLEYELSLPGSDIVSISAKGSDDTLTSSLMDEMKSLLWLDLITYS